MKSKPSSVMDQALALSHQPDPLANPSRAWIMGVLNATPDSFYAGGRGATRSRALALAARHVGEGVDVLDIGGESTRPGSLEVPLKTELARIVPLVEAVHTRWPKLPISIDTQKAKVAQQALAKGASIINDVSALRHDPAMVDVAASHSGPVVLMHMRGAPRTMQQAPRYKDVIRDIVRFFEERMAWCLRHGVAERRLILDPGIGFGKTLDHNLAILKRLPELARLGRPLLIGVSRKSFIGKLQATGKDPEPPENRLEGSLAAGLYALGRGASGLRVHDVGATRRALAVWQFLNSKHGTDATT